jgi:N4-gp56 family major capsid protein
MSFFFENGLVGPDPDNDIIVLMDDLEKDQGDQVTFGQVRELNGEGVSGDATMEGNEEEPDTFDDAVVLNQRRNAVRDGGKLSSQRPADKRLRAWARRLLSRWLADIIDQDIFDSLASSPTKVIYGGDATSTATIESGDYMTLQLISKAVTFAEKTSPMIMGKNVNGVKSHVCVMSPDQSYDVMESDAAWAQAQREAQRRGGDNPIFKNALGMWRDCALHRHKRTPIATTWGSGSNLNGATALFMGVSAGGSI